MCAVSQTARPQPQPRNVMGSGRPDERRAAAIGTPDLIASREVMEEVSMAR